MIDDIDCILSCRTSTYNTKIIKYADLLHEWLGLIIHTLDVTNEQNVVCAHYKIERSQLEINA